MAPSGAGLGAMGCLLLWLLVAAQDWPRTSAAVTALSIPQCSSLDEDIATALSSGLLQSNIFLGVGCHTLTRDFSCTQIRNALTFIGSDGSGSSWDMGFELYQFSVEAGETADHGSSCLVTSLGLTRYPIPPFTFAC